MIFHKLLCADCGLTIGVSLQSAVPDSFCSYCARVRLQEVMLSKKRKDITKEDNLNALVVKDAMFDPKKTRKYWNIKAADNVVTILRSYDLLFNYNKDA